MCAIMQVPPTPASRQEKMLQQRQLALKRQRDVIARRSQGSLLGAGAVMAQQNQLHQKKAAGWAKFLVDPTLFEPPPAASPPLAASPVPEEGGGDGTAAAADDVAPAAAPMPRPSTGDSTDTLLCDNITSAPACAASSSAEAGDREGSPVSGGQAGSSPASCMRRPGPSKEQGWDLQVGAPEVAEVVALDGEKDKGRGRSFWKPWKATNARHAAISADEPTVVSTFGEGVEELAGKRPVDSRVVTPFAMGEGPLDGIEDISPLPGVLEESIDSDRPQFVAQAQRPRKQETQPTRTLYSEDDLVGLGTVPTMELED